MELRKLDHLVLTVNDIDSSISFYVSILGMEKQVFAKGRVALRYGSEKINLHKVGSDIEPKSIHPTPGSADLCFITETPIAEVVEQITSKGVKVVEGPVERTGAKGQLLSFYIRDPDGNLIEVANEV